MFAEIDMSLFSAVGATCLEDPSQSPQVASGPRIGQTKAVCSMLRKGCNAIQQPSLVKMMTFC